MFTFADDTVFQNKRVHEEKQKRRLLQLYKMNDVETMVGFIVPWLFQRKNDGISKLAAGKFKRKIFFYFPEDT